MKILHSIHLLAVFGVFISFGLMLWDIHAHHLATAYDSKWFACEFGCLFAALMCAGIKSDVKAAAEKARAKEAPDAR